MEQTIGILRAVTSDPKHTMALKVTALTYLRILRGLNVGQKRLYDLFVEIAGYSLDAFVTKAQVKEHLQHKMAVNATDEEINEFFRIGKANSTDTHPDKLSAAEYMMNIHAFPVYPPFKNPLAAKIANLSPEVVSELTDWIKRIDGILESIKRANVSYQCVKYIGLLHD